MNQTKRVLFVCLGNICRSPAAEGYFKYLVSSKVLESSFVIDSAGTSAYHAGEAPDSRMQSTANSRGYSLNSVSRGFNFQSDFNNFDIILTMDSKNYQDVISLASTDKDTHKVFKMTDFCEMHNVNEVPDPYYKGLDGFELVMDIIEDACNGLLKQILKGKL